MRLKKVKGANEIIVSGKYYVNEPFSYKGRWNLVFGNDNPIRVEIGMGKGNFIISMAQKYPNINFIGIEKFDSVIVRAIQKSNELELNNLKIIRMDAEYLSEVFDREVEMIYLNFSDPWPKERHAKRRLTSSVFLNVYDNIFESDKRIEMKTDNIDLFNYSLESLSDYGYDIIYKTNDMDCLDSNNVMTEYEKRFNDLGIKINKLIALKK